MFVETVHHLSVLHSYIPGTVMTVTCIMIVLPYMHANINHCLRIHRQRLFLLPHPAWVARAHFCQLCQCPRSTTHSTLQAQQQHDCTNTIVVACTNLQASEPEHFYGYCGRLRSKQGTDWLCSDGFTHTRAVPFRIQRQPTLF